MNYLLDTNVCIALLNGTSAKARVRYENATQAGDVLATSTVVAHELWYGVFKSSLPAQNTRRVQAFLTRDMALLDLNERDAQAAAGIRAELERKGTRIGEYDTLIAGQAYARKMTLVTANTREFRRVKGLGVEDWTL